MGAWWRGAARFPPSPPAGGGAPAPPPKRGPPNPPPAPARRCAAERPPPPTTPLRPPARRGGHALGAARAGAAAPPATATAPTAAAATALASLVVAYWRAGGRAIAAERLGHHWRLGRQQLDPRLEVRVHLDDADLRDLGGRHPWPTRTPTEPSAARGNTSGGQVLPAHLWRGRRVPHCRSKHTTHIWKRLPPRLGLVIKRR